MARKILERVPLIALYGKKNFGKHPKLAFGAAQALKDVSNVEGAHSLTSPPVHP
jgi:hypothetical protein